MHQHWIAYAAVSPRSNASAAKPPILTAGGSRRKQAHPPTRFFCDEKSTRSSAYLIYLSCSNPLDVSTSLPGFQRTGKGDEAAGKRQRQESTYRE